MIAPKLVSEIAAPRAPQLCSTNKRRWFAPDSEWSEQREQSRTSRPSRSAVRGGLAWMVLLAMLVLCAHSGEAAVTTRHVVIADADGWSTALVLGALANPESVRLTDCTLGPIMSADVVANGSILLRDAGRFQCDLRNSIGLLTLAFSGLAESRLLFIDPRGAKSSLTVPSLDVPLDTTHPQVLMRLVTNDDVEVTFVIVFGRPAPLKLYVYNEHDNLIEVESIHKTDFDLRRDFLFYRLKTTVSAGTLILTQENSAAPPPNSGGETYFGFGVVSRPDGTSAAVRLWQTSAAPVLR